MPIIFKYNRAIRSMNILIPLAGKGSRFRSGYQQPKPLIPIHGKPMIQCVIESIKMPGKYIFIIQAEHDTNGVLSMLLRRLCNDCVIISIDYYTDGAAQSCLLAKQYIDNDLPLIMTNCDQVYDWDPMSFIKYCTDSDSDGVIITEHRDTPTYSYAALNDMGHVTRLAEKDVISEHALIGMHYWRRGSDFVRSATELIAKDIREKGEYYISLTYNELISAGKKVTIYPLREDEHYHVVGTPAELNTYISLTKTTITVAGNITKDTIYYINNMSCKEVTLGGIMNFWAHVRSTSCDLTLELAPLCYGESVILIDSSAGQRYNRSELKLIDIPVEYNRTAWYHMMYINQVNAYNVNSLEQIDRLSGVTSCDICGGVEIQDLWFDVTLLKYFDFVFLSLDDLHPSISIDDMLEHVRGFLIIHQSHEVCIRGCGVDHTIPLDASMTVPNVNVLGAGDFFAAAFVAYIIQNGNVANPSDIYNAVAAAQRSVFSKLSCRQGQMES